MDKVKFPPGHDVYADDLGDPDPSRPSVIPNLQGIVQKELEGRLDAIGSLKGIAEGFTLTPGTNKITVAAGQGYDSQKRRLYTAAPTDVTVAIGDEGKYLVARIVPTGYLPTVVYGRTYFKKTLDVVQFVLTAEPGDDDVRLGKVLTVNFGSSPVASTNPIDVDYFSLTAKYPFIVVAADGTGDFVTIQAAVDSVAKGGGLIYVAAGTYTITDPITIPSSNVTIVGSGAGTKINLDSAGVNAISINGGASTTPALSVIIQDMWLNLNYAGADLEFIKVSNAAGVRLYGLLLTNSGSGTSCDAVVFGDNVQDSRIEKSRISSFARGVLLNGSVVSLTIGGSENHISAFSEVGIDVIGSNGYVNFSGNTLIGAGGTSVGVRMAPSTGSISRNVISGCQKGVHVTTGSRITINKNVIVDNSAQGVHCASTSSKVLTVANILWPNGTAYLDDAAGAVNKQSHNITT